MTLVFSEDLCIVVLMAYGLASLSVCTNDIRDYNYVHILILVALYVLMLCGAHCRASTAASRYVGSRAVAQWTRVTR